MLWRTLFALSIAMISGSVVVIAIGLAAPSSLGLPTSSSGGEAIVHFTQREAPNPLPTRETETAEAPTESEAAPPTEAEPTEPVDEAPEPTATAEPTPEPTPADTPTSEPTEAATQEQTAATATPEPTNAPTQAPTVSAAALDPAAPVQIWSGGDSMAYTVGVALESLGADDPAFDGKLDNRGSSGLTRPDFFDWPAYLAQVAETSDPDVMVFLVGANDRQGMVVDGTAYQPPAEEWLTEYRRRVGVAMDAVEDSGTLLIWVGAPVMQSASFSADLAAMNAIYRDEASMRPWVAYLDSWVLLANESGGYRTQATMSDGSTVTIREPDGVHLTWAGGQMIAEAALGLAAERLGR